MNEKIISIPQARQKELTRPIITDGSNVIRLARLPGKLLGRFDIRAQQRQLMNKRTAQEAIFISANGYSVDEDQLHNPQR